jgi:leucyl-tRNA synthetase
MYIVGNIRAEYRIQNIELSMEYNFRDIEKKWQQWWKDTGVYKVSNDSSKPKYYALDMFPYPSGAGLHVGHPLGYIASDIYARFKRLKGFNVLHPMGYDSFGLPAEQYAIEHGIHPAVSTEKNINNFRQQLDNIGFSFDWSREVRTSDPKFYKWTQWIFLQLFKSFYNRNTGKAEPIDNLIAAFEQEGNKNHPVPDAKFEERNPDFEMLEGKFSADQWKALGEKTRQDILMEYRLAYCGYGEVNWCEALGTVLANDEVINGVSERGGYPVVKKKLRQWYLRITEYADRLLEGLLAVDFSESMKEMQANWIGKSEGAEIAFEVKSQTSNVKEGLRVYTTRPDTIFGVDFMVIAPEHELVEQITTAEQKEAVEEYITYVKSRSERERMAEKKISGVFTGAYCIHPFSEKRIPVWISEYVLIGYGTGAIMAVPCGDERDHKFAKHFGLEITNIIGLHYNGEEANPTKDAVLENSDFLNGMVMKDAIGVAIEKIEELNIGKRKVNYKMRDAAFSRQRYWGEPFPIVWTNGIAYPLDEKQLPLELPYVESYKPGPEGEGPLANIADWTAKNLETNTMPGYAGSSWYFLRYMDPHNEKEFCDRKYSDYWGQVDLYIGGTEHAVGHLLYSRMWTKFLYDRGWISHEEPYKRLVNQGMIQGSSRFGYRLSSYGRANTHPLKNYAAGRTIFISKKFYDQHENSDSDDFELIKMLDDLFGIDINALGEYRNSYSINISPIHVDVNIVDGVELNISEFRKWRNGEYRDAILICEDGSVSSPDGGGREGVYICGSEIEKMSKSKFNVVNPDDLVIKYGADTFRMYEMFLGPVEMSKPWDTKGIEGVHRFLKKFWRLFADEEKGLIVTDATATNEELKVLHKTIKKVEEDTERFSFNTGVSAFMIATNELTDLKCHKRSVLEPLIILLAPYAPHIAEELYQQLRTAKVSPVREDLEEATSVADASYPVFEEKYVRESSKTYPVAINGKTRTELTIALDATQQQVEEIVLANEIVKKWMQGKSPKKVIYVKNKMVNVVV